MSDYGPGRTPGGGWVISDAEAAEVMRLSEQRGEEVTAARAAEQAAQAWPDKARFLAGDVIGRYVPDMTPGQKYALIGSILDVAAPVIAADLAGRLAALRTAVQRVLDDDETGAGGWGPDVTMAAVLREAMEATEHQEWTP